MAAAVADSLHIYVGAGGRCIFKMFFKSASLFFFFFDVKLEKERNISAPTRTVYSTKGKKLCFGMAQLTYTEMYIHE